MSSAFIQAKLLICLVGRHKGETLVSAAKAAGGRGGTMSLGRTVGSNPLLQALSLADVQQDIVFTLMGPECATVLAAIKKAVGENPKKLGGLAVLLDVSGMMIRQRSDVHSQNAPEGGAWSKKMESGYELITVITNSGYGDDVMAAARKAGATGGTILNARGTGTEEDVRFFGITLVPEKEMLLIVAAKDKVADIVREVSNVPKLNEPGGGIVYTMGVEEFMVLGK
jgi:nitrogen regulatory protein PII